MNASRSSKVWAFVAYLLLALGWLLAIVFRRRDAFVRFHARQSLGLTLLAIAIPLIYAAFAWLVTWIPLAGTLLAAGSFSLVIAAGLALLGAWIAGMIRALRGEQESIPIFGGVIGRLPGGD